jgi:hypothetical protein
MTDAKTAGKPIVKRGGYGSGSKPISQLAPPPKTPGIGAKRGSVNPKK